MRVLHAATSCSIRTRSLIPERAGLLSIPPSPVQSSNIATAPTEWSAPRSLARAAVLTWGMYLTTARQRPESVTASIPFASISSRNNFLHTSYCILHTHFHMPRYGKKAQQKVRRAMHEMKRGQLKSGKSHKTVKSRKQAIAIGLSEARRAGGKVPANPNR